MEKKTTEEKIQDFIEKLRPYAVQLWASRKKLIIFNTVILALTLAYLFFIAKPFYKSTLTILPDYGNKGSELMGSLSGLASIAGVSVGETPPTQIYQNLLTSETVLSSVIYTKYQTKEFSNPVNLIEYFEFEPDKSIAKELQQRHMFLKLYKEFIERRMVTDYDRMTKILTVTVEMPESKLSADVINKLASYLDNYVRTKRKSFAVEQRKYLEMRVAQVKDTLTYFEERLKNFRSRNRMTLQSPELQLEQMRLTRNVEIHQTVYAELFKQLELVKLQEIKDTPVVNIKEEAKEPVIKYGPKRFITLIILMFFSVLFSAGYFVFNGSIKKYAGYAGINFKIGKKRKNKIDD